MPVSINKSPCSTGQGLISTQTSSALPDCTPRCALTYGVWLEWCPLEQKNRDALDYHIRNRRVLRYKTNKPNSPLVIPFLSLQRWWPLQPSIWTLFQRFGHDQWPDKHTQLMCQCLPYIFRLDCTLLSILSPYRGRKVDRGGVRNPRTYDRWGFGDAKWCLLGDVSTCRYLANSSVLSAWSFRLKDEAWKGEMSCLCRVILEPCYFYGTNRSVSL